MEIIDRKKVAKKSSNTKYKILKDILEAYEKEFTKNILLEIKQWKKNINIIQNNNININVAKTLDILYYNIPNFNETINKYLSFISNSVFWWKDIKDYFYTYLIFFSKTMAKNIIIRQIQCNFDNFSLKDVFYFLSEYRNKTNLYTKIKTFLWDNISIIQDKEELKKIVRNKIKEEINNKFDKWNIKLYSFFQNNFIKFVSSKINAKSKKQEQNGDIEIYQKMNTKVDITNSPLEEYLNSNIWFSSYNNEYEKNIANNIDIINPNNSEECYTEQEIILKIIENKRINSIIKKTLNKHLQRYNIHNLYTEKSLVELKIELSNNLSKKIKKLINNSSSIKDYSNIISVKEITNKVINVTIDYL